MVWDTYCLGEQRVVREIATHRTSQWISLFIQDSVVKRRQVQSAAGHSQMHDHFDNHDHHDNQQGRYHYHGNRHNHRHNNFLRIYNHCHRFDNRRDSHFCLEHHHDIACDRDADEHDFWARDHERSYSPSRQNSASANFARLVGWRQYVCVLYFSRGQRCWDGFEDKCYLNPEGARNSC